VNELTCTYEISAYKYLKHNQNNNYLLDNSGSLWCLMPLSTIMVITVLLVAILKFQSAQVVVNPTIINALC
jgi:type IV secretory pathway TrbF-like protein